MFGAIRDVRGITNADDYRNYVVSDNDDGGSASARERNDRESRRSNRHLNRTSARFVDGADFAIADAMAASRADPSLDVTAMAEAIAASLVRARMRTRSGHTRSAGAIYTGASDTEGFTDDGSDSENPDSITRKDRLPYDRKPWRGEFINVTPYFFSKPNAVARVVSTSAAVSAASRTHVPEPGAPAVARRVREMERRRRREHRAKVRAAEEGEKAAARAAAAAAAALAEAEARRQAAASLGSTSSAATGQGQGRGLGYESSLLARDIDEELAEAAIEIAAAQALAETKAAKGKDKRKGPESDSFEELSQTDAAPEDGHVSIFDDDDDDDDDDEDGNAKKTAASEHLDIISPSEAAQASVAVPAISDDIDAAALLSLVDYWSSITGDNRRVLLKARLSVFLEELEPIVMLFKLRIPFAFSPTLGSGIVLNHAALAAAEAAAAAGQSVVLAAPTTFRITLTRASEGTYTESAVVSFNDRYGREIAAALAAFHCLVSASVAPSPAGPSNAAAAAAAAAEGRAAGAGVGRWPLKLGLWSGHAPHRHALGGKGWQQVIPASEKAAVVVAPTHAEASVEKKKKKSWRAASKGIHAL